MDTATQRLMAAAGSGPISGDPAWVDDVFKQFLYTGTGGTHSINNGIDFTGAGGGDTPYMQGGLVWLKNRTNSGSGHFPMYLDTLRGGTTYLLPAGSGAEGTDNGYHIQSFNNNGFTLQNGGGGSNQSGSNFLSYSFRRAKKFMDIVTFSGQSGNLQLSHSLGSVPGMIVVKRRNGSADWNVYHRSLGAGKRLRFTNNNFQNSNAFPVAPTATHFTVGNTSDNGTNTSGGTYIAYLFAHDAGGYGEDGQENIISCGSYVGNGSSSAPPLIDVGYEPQFFIVKSSTQSNTQWMYSDAGRGAAPNIGQDVPYLTLDTADSEAEHPFVGFRERGFQLLNNSSSFNTSGQTYVYMTIRRSEGIVGKPITDGAYCFDQKYGQSSGNPVVQMSNNVTPDLVIQRRPTSGDGNWYFGTRGMGEYGLYINSTAAQWGWSNSMWWYQSGWNRHTGSTTAYMFWLWKRHRGLDIVNYGPGTGGDMTVKHSLGVVPEMMWCREKTNGGVEWKVYHKDRGPTNVLRLNNMLGEETSQQIFQNSDPTDEEFYVKQSLSTSNAYFVNVLFSSVAGVSKVGSYSGNSSGQTITTGFQPRYMWLKRTNTGDSRWYVLDTTRGWGSGSDSWLGFSLSGAAGSWDFGAPTSNGFTLTGGNSHTNSDGNFYIYYAHA